MLSAVLWSKWENAFWAITIFVCCSTSNGHQENGVELPPMAETNLLAFEHVFLKAVGASLDDSAHLINSQCPPKLQLTFNVCIVAPRKATGASSVGGSPAWEPAAATRLLQLMRKLTREKACEPSTHTSDSARWSTHTVWPSLRLKRCVKEHLASGTRSRCINSFNLWPPILCINAVVINLIWCTNTSNSSHTVYVYAHRVAEESCFGCAGHHSSQ